MNWKDLFKKPHNRLEGEETDPREPTAVCTKCGEESTRREIRESFYICPRCGSYFRMTPRQRIAQLCDEGSFSELFADVKREPLFDFPGYDEKLTAASKKTGDYDSVMCGKCTVNGINAVIFIFNGGFMMGSMGSAAGEKTALCFDYARQNALPVIGVAASGGARMQEGIISLMQMAKVSGAIKLHSDEGLLYLTLLTDPTTGGVSASLAMLGDIIIAEPKALICFAGPRVIEQSLKQKLPEGFAQAEELLREGFIDGVAGRAEQREFIYKMLSFHMREEKA